MSRVLLLNGSAHRHGCTATALEEMIRVFESEGVETELVQVGTEALRGCISCNKCSELGRCVFDDLVGCFKKRKNEQTKKQWNIAFVCSFALRVMAGNVPLLHVTFHQAHIRLVDPFDCGNAESRAAADDPVSEFLLFISSSAAEIQE